jgi:hypothetical protein
MIIIDRIGNLRSYNYSLLLLETLGRSKKNGLLISSESDIFHWNLATWPFENYFHVFIPCILVYNMYVSSFMAIFYYGFTISILCTVVGVGW